MEVTARRLSARMERPDLALHRPERDTARAVSQENVEVVRRFMDAIEKGFDAYWENPRSIAAALEAQDLWPEWVEAYEFVHPQIEWQTTFLGETFRGHLETARAWDDFLPWAEDYRPKLEEVAGLGDDHVFAVVGLVGKGKNSGMRMDARFYDVFTVREMLIVRIEEYVSRREAFEAAGLGEQAVPDA
jgi:ketosteroid isomerase-like protein